MNTSKNSELCHKYKIPFMETFKVSLFKFFSPITGFDICAFDSWLKTPDGKSCSDWIKEKYGDKAVKLVSNLLS